MDACSMDEWRPDQAACRARKNAADKEYWVDLHAELQQEDDRFQNRSDGEDHQDRRRDQAIGGQPPKLKARRRRRKTANAKRVKEADHCAEPERLECRRGALRYRGLDQHKAEKGGRKEDRHQQGDQHDIPSTREAGMLADRQWSTTGLLAVKYSLPS